MTRPRVLLFCHDGTGLGHLRRISRVADALRERFSTLVLCGMREAGWMVPLECGLVKLPDWDGIDRWRAGRAGRARWLDLTREQAIRFRAEAIRDACRLYQPDAVIVDYLPYGQRRELDVLFETRQGRRYFLHRGTTDTADRDALRGAATQEIADTYDRILVAADPRIVDLAAEDEYCADARAKVTYVGFVTPEPRPGAERLRRVVCSGGSGHQAEELMLRCVAVARDNPDIAMTVVLGPRSRLDPADVAAPPNCTVHRTREDLPELHRSAAVVVSSGGYNSMLESAVGGARLIVCPSRTGDEDEQRRFAGRLSAHHPVRLLTGPDGLAAAVRANWSDAAACPAPALRLDINGAAGIRTVLEKDLAGAVP